MNIDDVMSNNIPYIGKIIPIIQSIASPDQIVLLEQDGGTLMNQCTHGIDLLQWIMGEDTVCVQAQI